MKFHNIDKSRFRRGEYVGYCHGIWRITRDHFAGHSGWRATRRNIEQQRKGEPFYFESHTLEGISAMLAKEDSRTV